MAVLQADDITDLVNSTLKDLGRGKITEIASDLQEHVAMSRLLKKNRVGFGSGIGAQFNVLLNGDNNAKNVGLFNVDNVNQVDGTITGNVPWRHSTTGAAIDVRQIAMNRNPARVVELIKEKEYQKMISFADLMETNFWGEPSSSSDTTTPFGLKYWLTYNASEGFYGGNNSNFSSGPAAINSTTYPRWKNYTANYTDVSKTDLIRKMRKAFWSVGFKPIVDSAPIAGYGGTSRYAVYTTYDVMSLFEEALEAQNDNLGNDIASKDGMTTFRKISVEAVPYLQSNDATADSVVGLDWSVFKPIFLEGEFMRATAYKPAPSQHNVIQNFLDMSYNFICYDRRRNFLIAKSDWSA